MEQEYLLEMTGISKRFPGVQALDSVGLKVRKGTVHALVGENGAGKSTLMNILIGLLKPDCGTIKFDGEIVDFNSVSDALSAGIAMVHQELNPVPYMTVAENIFLGKEICYKNGLVNDKAMQEETSRLLEQLGVFIDPTSKMLELSTAYMQIVEIAKAISYNAKLIIMDEPTSAITEDEVEQLFKIIRLLRERGVSVIYITHKMDEIFTIADDVTIFRDGHFIDSFPISEATEENIIRLMVGRELTQLFPKENIPTDEVVLEIKGFADSKFKNVSFKLHKGEILGLAGLIGAGRTEVIESLFGLRPRDAGEIYIKGQKVEINSPVDAINCGIGLLTEDRKLSGLFLPLSVEDNITVVNIDAYIKTGLLSHKRMSEDCERMVKLLNIKTPSLSQIVSNLSGGNQQKVIIARWLLPDSDILIMDEPTRGIDVGAKAEIHKLMSDLAKQGKAIIMISSELPEILGMSDRIVVMHEGVVTGELTRDEATQENVMKLATGSK